MTKKFVIFALLYFSYSIVHAQTVCEGFFANSANESKVAAKSVTAKEITKGWSIQHAETYSNMDLQGARLLTSSGDGKSDFSVSLETKDNNREWIIVSVPKNLEQLTNSTDFKITTHDNTNFENGVAVVNGSLSVSVSKTELVLKQVRTERLFGESEVAIQGKGFATHTVETSTITIKKDAEGKVLFAHAEKITALGLADGKSLTGPRAGVAADLQF